MGTTCPGFVPHDTWGVSAVASTATSLSNAAPASVASERQSSRARSHAAPAGACLRPSRWANVVSSGPTRPALAPASMLMLQTVMRPSIDRPAMVEPRYSIT